MITRIEALNYRCLKWVEQDLGSFHVLVGPNGSGKSTFLDIPVLAGDILRHGTVDFGEAIKARAPNFRDLFWNGKESFFEIALEAEIPRTVLEPEIPIRLRSVLKQKRSDRDPEFAAPPVCRYEIRVGSIGDQQELGIIRERVLIGRPDADSRRARTLPQKRDSAPPPMLRCEGGRRWFTVIIRDDRTEAASFTPEDGSRGLTGRLTRRESAFSKTLPYESLFPITSWFHRFLTTDIFRVSLNNESLRRPSPPTAQRSFQPDGSNLPWLVHQMEVIENRRMFNRWHTHLNMELPELRRVRTAVDPDSQARYLKLVFRDGTEVPSWLVSDGTLHLLAFTLLAYLPGMRGTYLVEEPENAVHPTALQAIYDSLSALYGGQALVATHSPGLMSLAELNQILCFSKAEDGSVKIIPAPEHQYLRNWHHEVDLGVLFASGVLG